MKMRLAAGLVLGGLGLLGCSQDEGGAEALGVQQQKLGGPYGGVIYWCCSYRQTAKPPSLNPTDPSTWPNLGPLGHGYGGTMLDTAVELKTKLNQLPGMTFDVQMFDPSTAGSASPSGNAGIYLINPDEWALRNPGLSLPVPAQVVAPPAGRPAYSLNWAADGSWLWILGRDQGVLNGTSDYLRRVGFRSLLAGANWQISPPNASLVTRTDPSPGAIAPTLNSFIFAGTGGLAIEADATESAWVAWRRRNSFPTSNDAPGAAYDSFYLSADKLPDKPLRTNGLSLSHIGNTRTVLPNPIPPATALVGRQVAGMKIHYTGNKTYKHAEPGFTKYTVGGADYWEDPNDYGPAPRQITDPTNAGDPIPGILGTLADYTISRLNLAAPGSAAAERASVEPSDGSHHCDCAKCRALLQHVEGPFTDTLGQALDPAELPTVSSTSDRVFFTANAMARAVTDAFPGQSRGVSLLAYYDHADVPHLPLEPNMMVWLVPYGFHLASTGKTSNQLIQAWRDKVTYNSTPPIPLGAYDYYGPATSSLGKVQQNAVTLQNRLQTLSANGIKDIAIEAGWGGGPWGPIGLLGAQTAWNPSLTAASMLDTLVAEAFGQGVSPSAPGAPQGLKDIRAIYGSLFEKPAKYDFWGLHQLLKNFTDDAFAYVDARPAEKARFSDLESYVHYLTLVSPPQQHCAELYEWLWCMKDSLMLPTHYYSESVLQRYCPDPDWKLPGAIQKAADQAPSCPSPRSMIEADREQFDLSLGREVSFSTEIGDYLTLPDISALPNGTVTTPSLPLQSGASARVAMGYSQYIVAAPGGIEVTVHVSIPHTTVPVTLTVSDAAGNQLKSVDLENPASGSVATSTSLGVLAAGNYSVEISPNDKTYKYAVWTSALNGTVGIPYASKDGAFSYTSPEFFSFYVPAEVDHVLLSGVTCLYELVRLQNGTLGDVIYNGPACPTNVHLPTLDQLDNTTFKLTTAGRPGIWRVKMQSKTGAHLINLPDVFSNYSNAVITSKRIRTETVAAVAGGNPLPVVSPNLKYNNRFMIKLPTPVSAGQTLVSINAGSALSSPPPILVQLLDAIGGELAATHVVPGAGSTNIVSPGAMGAGDYEVRITNPNVANGYAITVPPGFSFWSVDGYALGNVYSPSYRAVFTVPKNTQYIQMIAKPTGTVGIAMYTYNASGTEVAMGSPVAKGNNVYQLAITPNTEDTLWSVNLKGDYWSDIRLLNAPQIMSFNKKLHATMVPAE